MDSKRGEGGGRGEEEVAWPVQPSPVPFSMIACRRGPGSLDKAWVVVQQFLRSSTATGATAGGAGGSARTGHTHEIG